MKGEWQKIETAPKDGTLFLAYCPETDPVYDGFWSFRPKGPPGIAVCLWDDYTDPQQHINRPLGWAVAHIAKARGGEVYAIKPTHWMPLPEPPQ